MIHKSGESDVKQKQMTYWKNLSVGKYVSLHEDGYEIRTGESSLIDLLFADFFRLFLDEKSLVEIELSMARGRLEYIVTLTHGRLATWVPFEDSKLKLTHRAGQFLIKMERGRIGIQHNDKTASKKFVQWDGESMVIVPKKNSLSKETVKLLSRETMKAKHFKYSVVSTKNTKVKPWHFANPQKKEDMDLFIQKLAPWEVRESK